MIHDSLKPGDLIRYEGLEAIDSFSSDVVCKAGQICLFIGVYNKFEDVLFFANNTKYRTNKAYIKEQFSRLTDR
jgi:hypothetical protein